MERERVSSILIIKTICSLKFKIMYESTLFKTLNRSCNAFSVNDVKVKTTISNHFELDFRVHFYLFRYCFSVHAETEEQQRTRFQVELEFIQCLANPNYLHCE